MAFSKRQNVVLRVKRGDDPLKDFRETVSLNVTRQPPWIAALEVGDVCPIAALRVVAILPPRMRETVDTARLRAFAQQYAASAEDVVDTFEPLPTETERDTAVTFPLTAETITTERHSERVCEAIFGIAQVRHYQ